MVTIRTRVSTFLCLALTLGVVVNIFGLQSGHRQPIAAIADAVPLAATPSAGTPPVRPKIATEHGTDRSPTNDAASQLQASADADLSVRTTNTREVTAKLPVLESAAPEAKLVSTIQRELSDRGYATGAINGRAGLMTRSAIMAFEFDRRFPLTGDPSEELLRRILLDLSGPDGGTTLPPGETAGRIIAGAQRLLQRLGYDPGPVNGTLNEQTRKAVRQFEADVGMLPKGRISGDVMAEIARHAHARIEVYDEALSH